jgi:cytochrome c1
MFSYSFSFPHFVQNPKFQFRVKLHFLVIIVLVFLYLLFYLVHKHINSN